MSPWKKNNEKNYSAQRRKSPWIIGTNKRRLESLNQRLRARTARKKKEQKIVDYALEGAIIRGNHSNFNETYSELPCTLSENGV